MTKRWWICIVILAIGLGCYESKRQWGSNWLNTSRGISDGHGGLVWRDKSGKIFARQGRFDWGPKSVK